MLPPPGAIAAGGLYTATEFDLRALDPLRPSMVEMGRAVVRRDHRNGAVILMMWAGILAYLDRRGYDYVIGCVSVPTHGDGPPGSNLRGVRDLVLTNHRADRTVHPFRPVVLDSRGLDSIQPPARPTLPPLMRGYLRLGARICGQPAHDPSFGVGDFPTLLDKRQADLRYLNRLRSAAAYGSRSPAARSATSGARWSWPTTSPGSTCSPSARSCPAPSSPEPISSSGQPWGSRHGCRRSSPSTDATCGNFPRLSTRWSGGYAKDTPLSPSPKGPPTAASITAVSTRRCSKPPSTPTDRCNHCA